MLKGRGRDPRATGTPPHLAHLTSTARLPAKTLSSPRTPILAQRPPMTRPEPDYEVVEFPTEEYVNAKLQPPPPPPPRPPTGHPIDAGASCGLCGGGGARVRCSECGRRALCASCDDMYHRHPKRRNHQRQALSPSQIRDERPPLPPKVAAPPVPPPRKHKISGDRMSASPRPPQVQDQRRATLGHHNMMMAPRNQATATLNHSPAAPPIQQMPLHLQTKLTSTPSPSHVGSMPYLPQTMPHSVQMTHAQAQSNTLSHLNSNWAMPRGSLQGYNMQPNMAAPPDAWDNPEMISPSGQGWGRPLRRGASVLELGGSAAACAGCAHCAPMPWRYGSCASLDHPWAGGGWPPACCVSPHLPQHNARLHPSHPSQTPQPYRRAESRTMSRAASRAGSRAASPAMSIRSRASRRNKHRTPSPPPLPSSDADSESESESDHAPSKKEQEKEDENSLGPAPPPPNASWQCEHCTFVNEPGVRVCAVCCRTPTTVPKAVADVSSSLERLKIKTKASPSPVTTVENSRIEQNGERSHVKSKKERTSTGCGPSPPREKKVVKRPVNRLVTPTRDQNGSERAERHDMGCGPSPPREARNTQQISKIETSPPREPSKTVRVSPYREAKEEKLVTTPVQHSVSVGPSPPRDNTNHTPVITLTASIQKKSTGTSPPREANIEKRQTMLKNNVSNTGTSPPPQSISTQTYEDPSTYERAPSRSRSRARHRFRDERRRERSHSRHSLSSDTRESDRSVRTVGAGGTWEWRERERSGSPVADRDWSRLSRRASHLDLRRTRVARRSSFYGSEAASPERAISGRAASMEALAGAGAGREAERGLELARLLDEAERLGFTPGEVQAALAQSPAAPLAWLRARWPGLIAAVRGAAARLAPDAPVPEKEARAALAKHRGAVWPAVTDCVDKLRRQTEVSMVSEERRLRGRVWGSPAGADDDAAPPSANRRPREDSSDEFEAPTPIRYRDDWTPLPLDDRDTFEYERSYNEVWTKPSNDSKSYNADDIARKLQSFLVQAGAPAIDEKLLLKGLLTENKGFNLETNIDISDGQNYPFDLIQSENDFIDAYNALTRLSPLPNINKTSNNSNITTEPSQMNNKQYIESNADKLTQPNNIFSNDEIVINSSVQNNSQNNKINNSNTTQHPNLANQSTEKQVDKDKQNKKNIKSHGVKAKPKQSKEILRKHTDIETNQEVGMFQINTNVSSEVNKDALPESQELLEDDNKSNSVTETESVKIKNLNDIVGSTQKLIQQMKAEINSDIISLDGRNTSQSEIESSSNDEQESSYSDSDDRSERTDDDLTSDNEKETSSSDEKSENISDQEALRAIRTSSEDNEQFEEALDHLENQLEDFKQENIEILDSIARSLQAEQTITVETNDSNKKNIKNQDSNNNSFVTVNSFEEIYDELSVQNNHNIRNQVIEIPQDNKKDLPVPPLEIKGIAKHLVNTSILKMAIPNKLIVTQNELPLFKAIIENVESENILLNNQEMNHHEIPNEVTIHINEKQNDSLAVESLSTPITVNIINEEILHNNSEIEITQRPENSNTNQEEGQTENPENSSTNQEDGQYLEPMINGTNQEEEQNLEAMINGRNQEEEQNLEPMIIGDEVHAENNTVLTNNKHSETEMLSKKEQSSEDNNNNQTVDHITEVASTPEKVSNTNIIKINTSIKSNIPKLVKAIQSNKTKIEKQSPKFVISKVPVRKASLKQYPAPAPPKAHFGNVQIGHVKQLQTKVFNNSTKPIISKTENIEIRPSTSTMSKKKPVPPPPASAPPKVSPPREKQNNYFRETCRTEDEWTDSDSEDSQSQAPTFRPSEDTKHVPSPPPPLTLRRVSGHIIDLATIRLPDGSPERQARMLLAEGATETWEQAQLAVELISQGTEPPAALLAALECADLDSALAYLHQDCELCASRLPEHEMVSMLRCTHRCCRECAKHYFTVQITERSIADCVCPYCKIPELESLPDDAWLEYFAHLDILLKTLLEIEVHELFQRKLRDRTLAKDPNFKWCMECSSGFFVHPKQKKLRCPECRSVSCASCRKPWSSNHEGLTCEQFATWLEDNDPDRSTAAVQQHLRENGLECPRCHFKYSLSRGGCMHFTCTQCKYEFCYGCGKPFTMGARCGLSDYCAKLGLHAHHPRNCLFYLRDKEPHELQTLLQMNNVNYETEATEGSTGRCPIQLQRETPTGLVDGTCGSVAPPNYAGLCKVHYIEYLAGLARGLDPIPIMDVPELVAELRRRALPLPERGPWDTDPIYAGMCAEIVKEKIPLD